MNSTKFDVVIVGAGPAGIICAMQLAKMNYSIALIEKKQFPRDKTCGDALSLDVVNQLKLIDENLVVKFKKFALKTETHGVRIVAPNQHNFDIPFYYKGEKREAYVAKRIDFDYFLFNELERFNTIKIFEKANIFQIETLKNSATVSFKNGQNVINHINCEIIIGADGANSFVAKNLSNNKINLKHHSAGLRVYYENVKGFNKGNFIELHFIKEILPGYLWIFPLPNNQANIGIGMLSHTVSKKKINLRKKLNKLIKEHSLFKDRFKNAVALENVKGFGLPLGNKKRKISGNRFLLLGDAAGLIDPFSGEGVGNAIRSARIAAKHVDTCFLIDDFGKTINNNYDIDIYKQMEMEFKVSRNLQRLCKYPILFNSIVNKANKSKTFRNFLIGTMENVEKKKLLTQPNFYFKLLFNR